jgi:pimeloyl-ACP methyl ester carboxylesterase
LAHPPGRGTLIPGSPSNGLQLVAMPSTHSADGSSASAPPRRLPALTADCTLVRVEGGPHNIGWTHPEIVNPVLLAFLEGGLEAVDAAREKVATA